MPTKSLPLALALLLPAFALAEERPRVVVLESAERAAYTAVVAGFSAELRGEVSRVRLEEAEATSLEKAAKLKPALVLAIGPAAAVGAKRALPDVPIVFVMVPYLERYGLEGPRVTGISMTGDFSAELSALKATFPSGKRVGLLHDPRYSTALLEEIRPRAKAQGLTLVPLEVEGEAGLGRTLAAARGKVDAVMMVGDKTVATAAIVKRAIAFAEEEKVPFVALSPPLVKEGAFLSISPNPVGVGQQAGRLANRILHEKVDPGALAVAPPEGLEMAVNLSTARKLGVGGELAQRLLELAARMGYPVKVFE